MTANALAEIARLQREVEALRRYGDPDCTAIADNFLKFVNAGGDPDDFDCLDTRALDEQLAAGRRMMDRIMAPARVRKDGEPI